MLSYIIRIGLELKGRISNLEKAEKRNRIGDIFAKLRGYMGVEVG